MARGRGRLPGMAASESRPLQSRQVLGQAAGERVPRVPATSTFSPTLEKDPQGQTPLKAQLADERAFSVQASWQGKESNVIDKRNHSWAKDVKPLPPLLSSPLLWMPGSSCHGTECISWCISHNGEQGAFYELPGAPQTVQLLLLLLLSLSLLFL